MNDLPFLEDLDSVPSFGARNFFRVLGRFLHLWLIDNTKHRLFYWYMLMLNYIAGAERHGGVPNLASTAEKTDTGTSV